MPTNYQKEHREALKAMQENNIKGKSGARHRPRTASSSSSTRPRTALSSGPDVFVVSPSQRCGNLDASEAGCLSNASTPEKDAETGSECKTLGRGLSSAHSGSSQWEDRWTSRGLARSQIKSAVKDDRRFMDDNRFGCHFTSTGMPFSVMRSPRISKVRDDQAIEQTILDSKMSRCRTAGAANKGRKDVMPRHAPGEIPEYIVQRKEKQRLQVLEEAHERARKALVPDGFRLVPDTERALAEKATREMWQEAMSRFVRMPPHDATPGQLHRRQELEQTIAALEEHLKVLSKDGGGALLVPQGLALAPHSHASLGNPPAPLSEGARIKMLQQGPKII